MKQPTKSLFKIIILFTPSKVQNQERKNGQECPLVVHNIVALHLIPVKKPKRGPLCISAKGWKKLNLRNMLHGTVYNEGRVG